MPGHEACLVMTVSTGNLGHFMNGTTVGASSALMSKLLHQEFDGKGIGKVRWQPGS